MAVIKIASLVYTLAENHFSLEVSTGYFFMFRGHFILLQDCGGCPEASLWYTSRSVRLSLFFLFLSPALCSVLSFCSFFCLLCSNPVCVRMFILLRNLVSGTSIKVQWHWMGFTVSETQSMASVDAICHWQDFSKNAFCLATWNKTGFILLRLVKLEEQSLC